MSLERLLTTLRARWRLFLVTWLATIAVVMAVSLAITPQYKASASLVVDRGSVEPIQGVLLPPGETSGYMATQLAVLQSENVAQQVVRALRLPEAPAWREKWREETGGRGVYEAWIAAQLLKRLDVRVAQNVNGGAPRDSAVLSVSYQSPNPQFSSAVANSFVDAYIATELKMRVEPARHYSAFFDERAKQLAAALKEAQDRLSAYRRQHGLIPSDEGIDVETQRLAELNSQLLEVQDTVTRAKSRQAQALASARQMPEVLGDPVVAALTTELTRQEARYEELRTQFGERHPDIVDLRAGMAALREKLQAAVRRASGTAALAVKEADQRLRVLRTAVEQQRAKVLRQKAERDAASVLQRDVQNAQRAYDAVLARANQTSLESQNHQTNIARLDVATPPARAAWPNVPLNAAAGAVLGLLLAVLLAVSKEARDSRLRTAQDVLVRLRRPVLLSLPDGQRQRKLPRAQRAELRLLGAQPRPEH